MEYLIWMGALVSLIGVGILIYCIAATLKARRYTTDEADLKASLQRLAAINMGALAVSAVGLMMVILGIVLA